MVEPAPGFAHHAQIPNLATFNGFQPHQQGTTQKSVSQPGESHAIPSPYAKAAAPADGTSDISAQGTNAPHDQNNPAWEGWGDVPRSPRQDNGDEPDLNYVRAVADHQQTKLITFGTLRQSPLVYRYDNDAHVQACERKERKIKKHSFRSLKGICRNI